MPFSSIEEGIVSLLALQRDALHAEVNPVYIPLLAKHFASDEAEAFDLATSVKQFMDASSQQRVLVLYGDAGSGKSSFLQKFALDLSVECTPESPIPLFISLPRLKNPIHRAIEETLENYGFAEEQIEELRERHSFVFIFDGYDEIHQLQNLYMSNRLNTWQAKTLISCRSQYVYNKGNPDIYFMPLLGGLPKPHSLSTFYVAPFNEKQIEAYLMVLRERGAAIPSYEEMQLIPGLKELVTTPFLLYMAVEVLPGILARYSAASSSDEDRRLKQVELYDAFITQWFLRQEAKLKMSGHITEAMPDKKPVFWRYAQALAIEMHKHDVTWVHPRDERVAVFFDSDAETEMIRSACPIKKSGESFGFWHQSLGTYFTVRTMYEEECAQTTGLTDAEVAVGAGAEGNVDATDLSTNVLPPPVGDIHLRLMTDDFDKLRSLTEKIDSKFKKRLFEIIEYSKKDERYSIGAANAISVLNAARVSFSRLCLDGIRISGANLTNLIAYKTSFRGADLSRCIIKNAYLAEANLDDANLHEAQWGEIPGIHWPAGSVTQLAFLPNNQHLIVAGDPGTITIYELNTGEDIKTYATGGARIVSLQISPDGAYFVIGCANGLIQLYHIQTGIVSEIVPGEPYNHMKKNPAIFHPDGSEVIFGSNQGLFAASLSSSSLSLVPVTRRIFPSEEFRDIESIQWSERGIMLGVIASFGTIRRRFRPGEGKTIQLWDMEKREKLPELVGQDFCLSPDGMFVVIMQMKPKERDKLEVYSVPSLVRIKTLMLPQTTDPLYYSMRGSSTCFKIVATKSEKMVIVTGHEEGLILLWDLVSMATMPVARFNGHRAPISTLTFSHGQRNALLASGTGRLEMEGGGGDGRVRLWDLDMSLYTDSHKENIHCGAIRRLLVSSLQQIISASHEGSIIRWETKDGRRYDDIGGMLSDSDIAFFHEKLYFLNNQYQLQEYCLRTKEKKALNIIGCESSSDRIDRTSLAISSDGTRVAVGTHLGELKVFNIESNSLLFSYKAKYILHLAFSSDATSRYLFLFGNNLLVVLDGHRGHVYYQPLEFTEAIAGYGMLTLHPLHHQILAMSVNYSDERKQTGKVMLMNVEEKRCLGAMANESSTVECAGFSPDGNLLAAGYYNGDVIIWQLNTYTPVYTLHAHSEQTLAPTALCFLNNKDFLIGRSDGTIQAWRLHISEATPAYLTLLWFNPNDLCLYDCSFYNVTLTDREKLLIKLKSGKFIADEVENIRKLLISASQNLENKNFSLAIELFNNIIHLSPRAGVGYLGKAICYQKLNNLAESEKNFSLALESHDKNPFVQSTVFYYRAEASFMKKEIEKSIAEIKRALSAYVTGNFDMYPFYITKEVLIERLRIFNLFYACTSQDLISFKKYFNPITDMYVYGPWGMTLLHVAVICNKKEIVSYLLLLNPFLVKEKSGVYERMRPVNVFEYAIGALAADKAIDDAIIENLIEACPDVVNDPIQGRFTALHSMTERKNYRLMHYLIVHHADVNRIIPGIIASPLFLAAAQGDLAAVSLLLDNGANPFLKTSAGRSVLSSVVSKIMSIANVYSLEMESNEELKNLWAIYSLLSDKYAERGVDKNTNEILPEALVSRLASIQVPARRSLEVEYTLAARGFFSAGAQTEQSARTQPNRGSGFVSLETPLLAGGGESTEERRRNKYCPCCTMQ